MNRLSAIRPFGQRIWLDNLSRELLQSGVLDRLIRTDGIAGVTSNPAIFEKAIRHDPRYQTDLARLKAVPIIMITSRTAEKHKRYAEEIGVNHYLGKPYDEDILLGLIRDFVTQATH